MLQHDLPFEPPTAIELMSAGELYASANEFLLHELKEDRRIERKTAGVHADKLGEYFCMWANTPPSGGLIAIGMEDNGQISGCLQAGTEHINNLETSGRNFCPDARYDVKRVDVHRSDDGQRDYVLLFLVYYRSDPKVVRTTRNKAFIRLGGSKTKLDEYQIREIEIDTGGVAFEQELVDYVYPADFRADIIQQYAENFRGERGDRLRPNITNEEILELREFGKFAPGDKFVPNVACTLVFAKRPQRAFPGCKIRFQRFEGEVEGTGERWQPVKDIKIDEGPIPQQIAEAEKVLESQLRTFTHFGPDNKFRSLPEYPKVAWYEALVNACVHRSYNLRDMNIFIRMFDDRLEIESPGGFPPLVTPQNIYNVHHPRNPFLFDAMFYLEYVRGSREGTRRIHESMKRYGLPQEEFSEKETGNPFVLVILRNNYKQRKVLLDSEGLAFVGEALFNSLSLDERRAVNYVVEHHKVKPTDLVRVGGGNWHRSKRVLEQLRAKGILSVKRRKDIQRDSGSYYFLKHPNGKSDEKDKTN